MKNLKSNYDLVLEVIEGYEDENVLNDFKKKFKKGENVSKEDYFKFCKEYVNDGSEMYYVDLNYKYIESDGDESVFRK